MTMSPECVGLVARPVFKTGLRALARPWRFDSPAFRSFERSAYRRARSGNAALMEASLLVAQFRFCGEAK